MSVYPFDLDDDTTLPRVDDNITETGQEAINALRDSVFNIEETLGIEPQGSSGTVASRLDASLNADGTIKASALASIGLVTLPITNNQVGSNAGIEESKLSLVHSTTDLYTLIVSANTLINSVKNLALQTSTDFTLHLSGADFLSDGSTSAKHVLSHIDLNSIPSDSRDPAYTWTGLQDKSGNLRTATNAAEALLQINDDFTSHQNATSQAHVASAIVVDTDNFQEIPLTATDAQSVFNYLDQAEILNMGQHRATQHANAIPKISRSEVIGLDGYGHSIVPSTTCYTYLTEPPNTFPVDDLFIGDDIIKFIPDNANFKFDALFSQVRVGDIIRVNYANGIEAIFPITSIRFTPGSEWLVRINGVNLCSSVDGYASARIDKALYDVDTAGIFATAPANARSFGAPTATNTLSSIIVADPRGAMALGLNFDPNQLNSTHYNLYLELYPTGNPADKVISLPGIDVTGNAGATPGQYTLSSVVASTNDKFREFGYNYRFIAFEYNGEFGVMLADVINNASFAIINGTNSSGTLVTGSYTNNVIGGNNISSDTFDALGFGAVGANLASPAYQNSWVDSLAAQIPTKVIRPLNHRYAIVNGAKVDRFQEMYLATDGYWDGYISNRTQLGFSTVETTYTVNANLAPSGIKAGKTIIVQPAISFDDGLYNDVDYGRFIIKSVNFVGACGSTPSYTQITVLNSITGSILPAVASAEPSLPVKLYFSYDSVGFNFENLIDTSSTSIDYKRFHDIYLNDQGKTFSHERMRMPIQIESGNLLGTNNFHIVDVSSKLRGYTDGGSLSFNKYLRFYVLNYDSVTGEFDGYLGKRNPLNYNVTKTGQIVTGRPNVVTRFYDETNIDYIDVIFSDSSSSPGSLVMSTSTPRYVDLEIFPSLRTHDELFLLSSCEVNWDPISGENIVQYLSNKREFGSVDETDFTDSAKNYIASANKYLHENGVIRGLDLEGSLSGGELVFKGGSAIINGKVVVANNQSVIIPQIYPQSTSLPQTLDWAICLNEFGNLVPIILTSSKQIFFATDGIQNYQVVSATFDEIINERKNLCLIAVANVTIASITINSVDDSRKFVQGLDSSAPLVWANDEGFNGNFYSIESLKTWINNSNGTSNRVKLRGNFIITDNLDLSGFTKTVIFDGASANVTVATDGSGKGILLGSNLHLENWKITYAPTGFSVGIIAVGINALTGSLLFPSGNISNLRIRNCSFQSIVDAYPSFISFNLNRAENVIIENNTFDSISISVDAPYYQPAIQIFASETSPSIAATLKSVVIKNNHSKKYHGILISRSALTSPGFKVNALIDGNTVGYIGYLFGSDGAESEDPNYGLIIRNNFVKFIGTFQGYTPTLYNNYTQSLGPVTIEGNICSWLRCQMFESANQRTSLVIKNNKFFADNSIFLDAFFGAGGGSSNNIAIYVSNTNASPYSAKVPFVLEGNLVDYGIKTGTTYGYDCAVQLQGNCNVINNIFGGINSSQYLMYCQKALFSESYYFKIEGNNFLRRSTTVLGYIKIDSENTSGRVVNNDFDKDTIDGSDKNLVIRFASGVPSLTWANLNNWFFYNNKNQSSGLYLTLSNSNVVTGEGDPTGNIPWVWVTPITSSVSDSNLIYQPDTPQFQMFYDTNDSAPFGFIWSASLNAILPEGCTFYKAELEYSADAVPAGSSLQLKYQSLSGVQSTSIVAWATGSNTLALNVASGGLIKRLPEGVISGGMSSANGNSILSLYGAAYDTSSNKTLTCYLKIYFKW